MIPARPGRFFSLPELTGSPTAHRLGIDNIPPREVQTRLVGLCMHVLDPLRELLGGPVWVTSGYRCRALNDAVGGSSSSQHLLGEAADIKCPLPSRDAAELMARSGIEFDQAIWYDLERGGHLHVSHTTRRPLRREVLHAPAAGGYRPWKG